MSEPDFLVGEKDPWVRKIGYRLHRAITRAIRIAGEKHGMKNSPEMREAMKDAVLRIALQAKKLGWM